MSKVAVTGGAGFLGSHIVRRLLAEGTEVSVIDDFSSGSIQNLKDLGVDQRCTVGDLKDYEFTRESLRGADTVFHLAAEVGSVAYLHGSDARELAALQSNLSIDVNVFRACLENRVSHVIYASSVSVYPIDEQMGSRNQFREEDSDRKVNPEGGYGWAKYIGEKQLALMSCVTAGVARIFHAYGENIYLKPDRSQVIGSLIRKAIRYPREGFVVWGDGNQRRCFVFVDDAIDAIFRLRDYIEKRGSLTVNVGSTEETSVRELARRTVELSKKPITIEFDSSKPTGALNRMPDLERVKKTLDWSPTTSFADGLERTFEWAKGRLSSGVDRMD
jgi:nucleoside-diphosphate-sugar epimerase